MTELRQEECQNTQAFESKSFNQLETNTNQLLRQLANQNFDVLYRQKFQEIERKQKDINRKQSQYKQRLSQLQSKERQLRNEQQRKGLIETRQKNLSLRENEFEEKVKKQDKELQILQKLQRLKTEIDRTQTENALNKIRNEHQIQMNKLNHQLRQKTYQFEQLKKKTQVLEALNKQIQIQFSTEKKNLLQLRKTHQDAKGEWQRQKSALRQYYNQQVHKVNKTMEKQYQIKTKNYQSKFQTTILGLQKQVNYLKHKIEQINNQKKMLLKQNEQCDKNYKQLKEKWNKSFQENQKLEKQLKKKNSQFYDQLQREKNALQANFSNQISEIFESCSKQNNEAVELIKKELNSNMDKIRKQYEIQLQKQKNQFNVERQEFKIKLKQQQDQALRKIQQYKHSLQQQINAKNNKINEIQALLKSIMSIILGRTYQIIDNSKLLEAVQSKMNNLNVQIYNITEEKTNLLQINNTLQSNTKEIRRWLRNITSLFSYEQAAAQLEKNKQYAITFQDVIDSINSFTTKLKITLSKYQNEAQEKETQINKLKQQVKTLNFTKNDLETNVGRLSEKNKVLEEKLRILGMQNNRNIQSINELNILVARLQKEKKELSHGLALKDSDIITLREEINGLQSGKAVFLDRIKEEQKKRQILSSEIAKLKENMRILEQQKHDLIQQAQNRKDVSDERLKKLQEIKRQMTVKQNEWRNLSEMQINKFRSVINELYDSPIVENSIQSMLQFIKNNKVSSEGEPLLVSHILQTASKERQLLKGFICDFLQCRYIKTTLLYKYDEFNKNFSNYLPIKSQYIFLILAKSQKSQIFGVVSTGIGPKFKAMAFNLNSRKTFIGESNVSSSTFDGGYLIFGQGEIRFKSNSNLQMVVTTRIFNTRYFSFMKQDLVGVQTGDSVLLDALEIHRIDY